MTGGLVASVGLLLAAMALFWIGMLGLLWRRNLIGMLVGVLFGWLSVALSGMSFMRVAPTPEAATGGAVFVLCAVLVGGMQCAVGLSVVVARVARRGTLDAQEADLLEG